MNQLGNVFDDAHIFRMTDDTGMFQHTRYNVPDLAKGYTTDDNARALIMAVMLYETRRKPEYLVLIYRYLAFILYAQNENGHFRNFMTYGRQFTEAEGSEECFGRCLWALGYTLASPVMPGGIKDACTSAITRALPIISSLKCLRGQAYVLIGLGLIPDIKRDSLILKLADAIGNCFEQCSGENWKWFEDSLTYDNGVLPWAMFVASYQTGQERFLHIGRESMEFLDQDAFRDGFFRPVGCRGWRMRGAEPALYDQQPVEASMSTLAHLAAYKVTGDESMLELARRSFAWYLGENSRNESLIDAETGGCFDGIMVEGLNRNQGAESIVGYAIANLALDNAASAPLGIHDQFLQNTEEASPQSNWRRLGKVILPSWRQANRK
ncbi:glycosyltransferase [Pelosinus baikalensis]|uniref:Glycosyltransferase n=1 Tax=Pelosinus baikalensis TaxID=2892015 RepID=A0ABS8HQ79_9FIRM|nr:glycosyltransferase [Pelosinus baikalensis]MCC5464714.1 glycosyltransferase [Pelosinus baikalensis]